MKRTKKIGILLGVLLIVCAATLAVMGIEQKKEEIRISEETVLQIPTDSVTALSWNRKNAPQPLAYHKAEDRWVYDEDEAFPVDPAAIEALLEPFEQFRAAFAIDNVEDYAQYGLDDPEGIIEITAEDKQYEIKLGDFSKMDDQRYVSIGDGKVYLAQHDPMDEFDAVLGDTMLHDVIPDFDQAITITFSGEENYRIDWLEDSGYSRRESDVYYRDTDPLDTAKVESYLRAMSGIILENDVTYDAAPEQLTEYGLDDPELIVTVEYLQQDEDNTETTESVTVSVSRDPAEAAAQAAAEDAEESDAESEEEITAYLRVGESKIIYKISTDEYESMMEYHYNDLRHEQIIPADGESFAAAEISMEGQKYLFTSELNDEETLAWKYDEREVDFTDLEEALTNLRAKEFTTERPQGKKEISVVLTLKDEDALQYTLELYRYDGERCLAVLDGQPVAFVPRTQMVDLEEAVNAIVLG